MARTHATKSSAQMAAMELRKARTAFKYQKLARGARKLMKMGYNQKIAARWLGVDPTTLGHALRQYPAQ